MAVIAVGVARRARAILTMLAVDLVAHRRAHVIGVREAALWSTVWVALGVAFGASCGGSTAPISASSTSRDT